MLMDKFPVIIYVGAALLGKIGGEMIITDPVLGRFMTLTSRSCIRSRSFLPPVSSSSEGTG